MNTSTPARVAVPGPETAAVSVSGLSKSYGGIRALIDMDLRVEPGATHAVVGENGAGKSTLMKILAGAIQADAGSIHVGGRAVTFGSTKEARRAGIAIVYQELSLFPDRSVLANLFPDEQPTRFGLVDRREMLRRAEPTMQSIGLDVDPETPVADLDLDERQLVEISRALIEEPRLLILDEPNSALNEGETRRLFAVLRRLRESGVTQLYVSHRLEEVFDIADRITVMRSGRLMMTRDREDVTMAEVVQAMVGSEQKSLFPPRQRGRTSDRIETDKDALRVNGLTAGDELRDVSFTAFPGEVVGLAGLEGSGVATLLGVLFGTRKATSGMAAYPDGGSLPHSPTDAANRGISLVPADRRNQGLMLDRSVNRNITLVSVGALAARSPWISAGSMLAATRRQIDRLRIKVGDPHAEVSSLSGGNQQKVVLGRWLETEPRLLLLDDPTRGVDVGAKHEIYLQIRALAEEGRVVLFRSTELPELVGLADRILIFYRGRLTLDLEAANVDDRDVLHAINTGTFIEATNAGEDTGATAGKEEP